MRLSGDFETCSQGDLPRIGAWKYAREPSTRILCFSWAVEDGEPDLWFPPNPPPRRLLKIIEAGCEFHAWNAQFEFNIWNAVGRLYGLPPLPIERFHCTMARALYWGVPPKLEQAAQVVGTSVRKDKKGADLQPRRVAELYQWRARTNAALKNYKDAYADLDEYMRRYTATNLSLIHI